MTILITSGKEIFCYYYIISSLFIILDLDFGFHTRHLAAVWVLSADDRIVAAANPVPILIKMAIK